MSSRRWKWLAGCALLVLAAGAAMGQPRPTPPGGGDRPSPGYPGENPYPPGRPTPGYNNPAPRPPDTLSFSGEYQEMVTMLSMTKAQQQMLWKITQDETKALEQYDKQHAKQLAGLQQKFNEAKNDVAKQAYQRQIDLIAANRQRVCEAHKRRALALLNPPQRATWASYKLKQIMNAEFSPAGLSSEQTAKIEGICNQAGQAATSADVEFNETLLNGLKQQILAGVLTPDQRKQYYDAKRAQATGATS